MRKGKDQKEIVGELELVSTRDLIHELASRHSELIVIRERKKTMDQDDVFVKTGFGPKGKKNKGFDLMVAISMLQATQYKLTYDYLDDINDSQKR